MRDAVPRVSVIVPDVPGRTVATFSTNVRRADSAKVREASRLPSAPQNHSVTFTRPLPRFWTSTTASWSPVRPPSHSRDTSWKMVRPTAKPLTSPKRAAASNEAASSSIGADNPSRTIPRQCGSWSSTAATIFSHAATLAVGSNFHQSGLMPVW